MNDINEFDKIIKDKMGGFSEMPPSHLWGNISAGIVPKAVIIPFYKQAYFKIALLIATIVVILGISWYIPQNPTYNTISSNIENIQNTKNEIINSKTPANNTNNENNNSVNTEAITIDNKELKKDIVKEENTITEIKKEVKTPVVKLANINKNSNSQEIDKTESTSPTVIVKNHTKANISTKSNSNDKITSSELKESIAKIEDNNKGINIASNNNKLKNTNITTAAVTTTEVIVKEAITPINSSEIIAETTINKEVVSKENIQEPVQPIVEEKAELKTETKKEEIIATPIEEVAIETPIKENITQIPDDKMPKSNFNPKSIIYDKYSIGAHYGNEQINIGDLKASSNNFDLSLNFQNVNFTAQTGIGFQISKDKNSYTQHYARNEYLATQVRFDSLIFVDDGNGGISPVPVNPYYTDIYDSINYTNHDETYETYYSIRIPLFIGYKKSLKYFDIFAQGGIIYSHIFRNETGQMNELDSESRMLESEYLINPRHNNQLQYVVSGGLSYPITKRLYLNAELMAKYYHFSLYQDTQSSANTWSYEVRFGITYLLN